MSNAKIKRHPGFNNENFKKQLEAAANNKKYKIIGNSSAIQNIIRKIEIIAPAKAKAIILITGESGTGKELIAQNIHRLSKRHNKPLITLNCAAIPEELIESELFGSTKGAFTGAESRIGKFELANNGTLFLDEIGSMGQKAQAKILRVLEEQKITRIGSNTLINVDVRIIAATNMDLKEDMKKGLFREDLYYRLNVIPIDIPPLRERPEDILPLIDHFFIVVCKEEDISFGDIKTFNEISKVYNEFRERAVNYEWPGNARELRNVITNLVLLKEINIPDQVDITGTDSACLRKKHEIGETMPVETALSYLKSVIRDVANEGSALASAKEEIPDTNKGIINLVNPDRKTIKDMLTRNDGYVTLAAKKENFIYPLAAGDILRTRMRLYHLIKRFNLSDFARELRKWKVG